MRHAIDVTFKPYSEMRYPTAGDYFEKDDILHFEIADTGNELYNELILIHEMVERVMVKARGITDQQIDEFDMAHLDSDDPGDEVDAPYRDEHCIATAVERMICGYLGISWREYDEAVVRLSDAG